MRIAAIVPVKSFEAAKQRLAGMLGIGSRQALAQAMFQDVLAALGRVEEIERIVVVTNEVGAAVAAPDDAVVLEDPEQRGQSAAAMAGVRWAIAERFDRVALLPGDTPLLDPAELGALLAAPEPILIVPDRARTGTNALVLTPPDAIEPSFGPDSLARHLAAAAESGHAHRVVDAPSLMHDVDVPEDLEALAHVLEGRRATAPRTRGALRQLDRAGARL